MSDIQVIFDEENEVNVTALLTEIDNQKTKERKGWGVFDQLSKTIVENEFVVESQQVISKDVEKVEEKVVQQVSTKNTVQIVTKKELALLIYLEENVDKKQRKIIMGRFMKELNMSDKGANTYYYNIQKIVDQQVKV